MKTFIIRSVLFFVISAVVTIGVFWFVSTLVPSKETVTKTIEEAATSIPEKAGEEVKKTADAVVDKIPEEGVPLSKVPLSDEQKKALAAVQIDVNTFVVTKSMILCGEEKLGKERMDQIIGGNAPGLIEITRLIPCLTK